MTQRAYEALRRQRAKKLQIELKGLQAPEGYENLVFVTKNNRQFNLIRAWLVANVENGVKMV